MKDLATQNSYIFAEFRLDPLRRALFREGQLVSLSPKAIEVLLALVERRTEVLSKDDLLKAVWPDQIVEENNLTVHISALRKALGEKKGALRFIVTIPGRGYSFVADVKRADLSDALVVEHYSMTHTTVEEEDTEPETIETEPVSEESLMKATAPAVKTGRLAKRIGAVAVIVLLAACAILAYKHLSAKKAVAQFERFEVRRQTNSGKVLAAVISPSGQYIAFARAETEGQSLWVRHVQTGSGKRIVEPKPVEYWGITFTPDGNYIYTTTFEKNQADPVLSKIAVLGGVVERIPVTTNAAVSFSPDGRRMAYVVSSSSCGGTALWTASADGSDKKYIALRKDPDFFAMQCDAIAWSPDGDTIACAVANNTDDGVHMSVVGYSALDGREIPLTPERWNNINGVEWASREGGLVLSGNLRPGLPSQVWFISSNDKDARPVTNDLNNYDGVSMSSDGNSLVIVQTDTTSSIWTGQVSADNKVTGMQQVFSEVGEIPSIGWRAGEQVVYISPASGASDLWMLEAASGRVRQLTVNLQASDFAISPDERYIVLVSNRAGKPNLWRIDADGGNLKQLTDGDGEIRPRFAPDGRYVFFQKGFGHVVASIWKVSIEGGELRQLMMPNKTYPDVSPDGRQIVYSYMDTLSTAAGEWRLGIAGVEEGKQIANFALPSSIIYRFTRWAADSRSLIFIGTVGGVSNLWLQTVGGRDARKFTDFTSQKIETFDLSRDGRGLAIVRSIKTSDAVLLDSTR